MNELSKVSAAELINEKHALVCDCAALCIYNARVGIEAMWSCGRLLMAEKQKCAHGEWISWLQINCPEIGERTAQRYMAHALKYATIEALNDALTARSMVGMGVLPDADADGGRASNGTKDSYLLYIQRACQWFNRCDVKRLNQTAKTVLKAQLEPLVKIYDQLG